MSSISAVHAHIRPNTHLFLRLPSETLRLIEIKLNTIIDVGKLGSFPSNLLIGRPYYHTYELLEKKPDELYSRLRIVSPAELHAEAALEDASTPPESSGEPAETGLGNVLPESYDLMADAIGIIGKNNRLTIDDASRQQLSQADIEELKKTAGGKEIVEKILANHAGLDEKTAFAKAKYTLRKHKKYLKRFAVLPVDLGSLTEFIIDKEAVRIMEIRQETLGLIGSWSNAHFTGSHPVASLGNGKRFQGGRWLVCDDTGGLVVAGLAERMNILYGPTADDRQGKTSGDDAEPLRGDVKQPKGLHRDFPVPAPTNSITLLHPAVQPNLSLLKYFGYDTSSSIIPPFELEHPLHTHLKPLSWLQLLHPDEDPTYIEPDLVAENVLSTWKSGKRGTYFKKRRRWERCRAIVDETREGGFEGLVVASHMDPVTILQHTLPLIRGGGHVVIYSPTIEPLTIVADLYSKDRRGAYIAHLSKGETPDVEDFALDPRLLLAPTVQTTRIREWQVLPGRTHPLMTGRGGAEGYVFTARKVIPLEGGVEARGNFATKRRKPNPNGATTANASSAPTETPKSDAMDTGNGKSTV